MVAIAYPLCTNCNTPLRPGHQCPPAKPFDLGSAPPELPDGDFSAPDWASMPPTEVRAPAKPVDPAFNVPVAVDSNVERTDWYNEAAEVSQDVFDSLQPPSVPVNALGNSQDAFLEALAEWQLECQKRNAWIERLGAEWKRRVAQYREARKQWEAYVAVARLEFQGAKATAVPARPRKR